MSNFLCDKCNHPNIDSLTGYVAGCQHYPPEHGRIVAVSFDGETFDDEAFYHGYGWYRSLTSLIAHKAIHPVAWRAE